jgi:hypothetical protein
MAKEDSVTSIIQPQHMAALLTLGTHLLDMFFLRKRKVDIEFEDLIVQRRAWKRIRALRSEQLHATPEEQQEIEIQIKAIHSLVTED